MGLTDYLTHIKNALEKANATEHTHRPTLKKLLEDLETGVTATNEPKREKCGAPDYNISKNNLTIGYIEAKDVGIDLDKVEGSEQFQRYLKALDNLILTDYLEFRWYKAGNPEPVMRAKAGKWDKKKFTAYSGPMQKEVEDLLKAFLSREPEKIGSSKKLAQKMAHIAHLIKDTVVEAFKHNEASTQLKDMLEAFKTTLIPDLTPETFADMYAQTLAYGLFAARIHHKAGTPFRREHADREIPKTNPLLQKLFRSISGPDLDDEPYVGFVDELVNLLEHADMVEVLSNFGKKNRQDDPIIHFYEDFLAAYDPKLREKRGVYYTPTPVVSYIVRSVDLLLKKHFGLPKGLASTDKIQTPHGEKPKVLVLDPATGTGTFLYGVIDHIREQYRTGGNRGMWKSYVNNHLMHALYGFELMMAPYAIAHLKLAMQLSALDLPEEERADMAHDLSQRLNVYLTNTLEEADKQITTLYGDLKAISEEAQEAAKIKKDLPVMVILGNPPYSGHSSNKGQWIDDLLKGVVRDSTTGKILKDKKLANHYYEVDGEPLGERNPKYLQDDYVKFIRWAQWKIEKTGFGVLAFITPHGFVDNPTFRGMRYSLSKTFDSIYIMDMHGSALRKDNNKDDNVFDIKQGVSISIMIKIREKSLGLSEIFKFDLKGRRLDKYQYLESEDVLATHWDQISIQAPFYLFKNEDINIKLIYEKFDSLNDIFLEKSPGVKTHRDDFVINFDKNNIIDKMNNFINTDISDDEFRQIYKLDDTRDWKLNLSRKHFRRLSDYSSRVKKILYRPFDIRWTIYSDYLMDWTRSNVLSNLSEHDNLSLYFMRQVDLIGDYNHFFVSDLIGDNRIFYSRRGDASIAPLYTFTKKKEGLFDTSEYMIDENKRFPNLSPVFIKSLEEATHLQFNWLKPELGASGFSPEDVLHYIYAVLHSPTYRTRYAEFLKIDFPRIPLPEGAEVFRELARIGEELVAQHLLTPGRVQPLSGFPKSGTDEVEKGYPKYVNTDGNGKVQINKTQYFEGVPQEIWEFKVGGYQVPEKWLKDRRFRTLDHTDIEHYQHMLGAMKRTLELMEEIEEVWTPT